LKKRCTRCHAKLDSHHRNCPYCGTMVRKPRGNVRVAPSVGTGGALSNITLPALTGKHLLAILAVIVVIIIFVSMLGCGSCAACEGCTACTSCSSCGACNACQSCGSCESCGSCAACEKVEPTLNTTSFHCEYHYGNTLYYVDGDKLMALEDGMDAGRPLASGKGIRCLYADEEFVYYLSAGQIMCAPVGMYSADGEALPGGRVLLDPVTAGLQLINGFSLTGESELCFWGQDSEGVKSIHITGRDGQGEIRALYTGKYSNVQCYRGGVYFSSGEDATNGFVVRVDISTGNRKLVYESKANYFTLVNGELVVCELPMLEDGSPADYSRLIYMDMESGEERARFERFPRVHGMIANDEWIYYTINENDNQETCVYRFRDEGRIHQQVFRKPGSFRLYGVADSYFSVYGENYYYICNYDSMPNFITISEHPVLD